MYTSKKFWNKLAQGTHLYLLVKTNLGSLFLFVQVSIISFFMLLSRPLGDDSQWYLSILWLSMIRIHFNIVFFPSLTFFSHFCDAFNILTLLFLAIIGKQKRAKSWEEVYDENRFLNNLWPRWLGQFVMVFFPLRLQQQQAQAPNFAPLTLSLLCQ